MRLLPSRISRLLAYVIAALFCTYLGRRAARAQQRSLSKLRKFSVSSALCAREADRPVVYANIAALMRAGRGVPKDTTEVEALSIFDTVVQDELPRVMEAAMGLGGVSV